jgi:hypothetical protein
MATSFSFISFIFVLRQLKEARCCFLCYTQIGIGNAVSFMYTWTSFFVLNGGGLSIVSVTFAQYMGSQVRRPRLD